MTAPNCSYQCKIELFLTFSKKNYNATLKGYRTGTILIKYNNHLNTVHLNTVFIWIPDIVGVRYSNGKVTWLGGPFKYRTFWTINWLFSVRFSDHHLNTEPFDNRTQIYHLNTRLVQFSDGYSTLSRENCDSRGWWISALNTGRTIFELALSFLSLTFAHLGMFRPWPEYRTEIVKITIGKPDHPNTGLVFF